MRTVNAGSVPEVGDAQFSKLALDRRHEIFRKLAVCGMGLLVLFCELQAHRSELIRAAVTLKPLLKRMFEFFNLHGDAIEILKKLLRPLAGLSHILRRLPHGRRS